MIQIYCGDGKGKTTAAMGLAVPGGGAGQSGGHRPVFEERRQRGAADFGQTAGVALLEVPDEMKFRLCHEGGGKTGRAGAADRPVRKGRRAVRAQRRGGCCAG